MDAEIQRFTADALRAGKSKPEIKQALQSAGWASPEIDAALALYIDYDFPVPVPRAQPYLSARDVFVYLTLFATLYASAYSLGSVIFELINRAFPDPLFTGPYYLFDRLRWQLSILVVVFPVFLFTFMRVSRALAADPSRRRSRIRRWLTYLTLFLAGVVLAVDVAVLVYNALGGELTVRFLLKIATVAAIAGGVAGYFVTDIRREDRA